jgi:hypothetical protein
MLLKLCFDAELASSRREYDDITVTAATEARLLYARVSVYAVCSSNKTTRKTVYVVCMSARVVVAASYY